MTVFLVQDEWHEITQLHLHHCPQNIKKSQFNKFYGMKLLNIIHFNQERTVTSGLLSVISNHPKRLTVDRLRLKVYLKLHV